MVSRLIKIWGYPICLQGIGISCDKKGHLLSLHLLSMAEEI